MHKVKESTVLHSSNIFFFNSVPKKHISKTLNSKKKRPFTKKPTIPSNPNHHKWEVIGFPPEPQLEQLHSVTVYLLQYLFCSCLLSLRNSQNCEHQKYFSKVIVLQGTSHSVVGKLNREQQQ